AVNLEATVRLKPAAEGEDKLGDLEISYNFEMDEGKIKSSTDPKIKSLLALYNNDSEKLAQAFNDYIKKDFKHKDSTELQRGADTDKIKNSVNFVINSIFASKNSTFRKKIEELNKEEL